MTASNAVIQLSALIVVLSLIAALIGLFWQGGEASASFTTIHGETVEIHGEGVYRYDSIFRAGANKGADVLTLALAIPLLIGSTVLFRRGSLRGTLLLIGSLVWFIYLYASLALGAAYNNLFLLYVVLFSASLFAFMIAFRSINPQTLSARLTPRAPHRGLAVFMFFSGLVTLVVWLEAPLRSLIQNQPPELLEHSMTLVTHALDLAIIVPAAILAGALILQRAGLGISSQCRSSSWRRCLIQ